MTAALNHLELKDLHLILTASREKTASTPKKYLNSTEKTDDREVEEQFLVFPMEACVGHITYLARLSWVISSVVLTGCHNEVNMPKPEIKLEKHSEDAKGLKIALDKATPKAGEAFTVVVTVVGEVKQVNIAVDNCGSDGSPLLAATDFAVTNNKATSSAITLESSTAASNKCTATVKANLDGKDVSKTHEFVVAAAATDDPPSVEGNEIMIGKAFTVTNAGSKHVRLNTNPSMPGICDPDKAKLYHITENALTVVDYDMGQEQGSGMFFVSGDTHDCELLVGDTRLEGINFVSTDGAPAITFYLAGDKKLYMTDLSTNKVFAVFDSKDEKTWQQVSVPSNANWSAGVNSNAGAKQGIAVIDDGTSKWLLFNMGGG